MSRRNLTPEQKERKLMIREFLKTNPIKDGNDLMAEVVEGSLEGEMDEELVQTGYLFQISPRGQNFNLYYEYNRRLQ